MNGLRTRPSRQLQQRSETGDMRCDCPMYRLPKFAFFFSQGDESHSVDDSSAPPRSQSDSPSMAASVPAGGTPGRLVSKGRDRNSSSGKGLTSHGDGVSEPRTPVPDSTAGHSKSEEEESAEELSGVGKGRTVGEVAAASTASEAAADAESSPEPHESGSGKRLKASAGGDVKSSKKKRDAGSAGGARRVPSVRPMPDPGSGGGAKAREASPDFGAAVQRHRRERKQTEFYNPAELEDATSLHRGDAQDSPSAGAAGAAGSRAAGTGGKVGVGRGAEDGALGSVGKVRGGGGGGGQGVCGDAELTPCSGCSSFNNKGLAHCFAQARRRPADTRPGCADSARRGLAESRAAAGPGGDERICEPPIRCWPARLGPGEARHTPGWAYRPAARAAAVAGRRRRYLGPQPWQGSWVGGSAAGAAAARSLRARRVCAPRDAGNGHQSRCPPAAPWPWRAAQAGLGRVRGGGGTGAHPGEQGRGAADVVRLVQDAQQGRPPLLPQAPAPPPRHTADSL